MNIERIKEVLENAKYLLDIYKNTIEDKELAKWYETIIWALEIQIPKKPIKCKLESPVKIGNTRFGKGTEILAKCPVCNNWLNGAKKPNSCDNCGQALDWSDVK